MKKKFKSIDDVKAAGTKPLIALLKKTFKTQDKTPVSFVFKAELDYDKEEELMPFIYLGELTASWKNYIKATKKDKDFMAGTAQLILNEQGEKVLQLQTDTGKGDKPIFLKALNKKLLKTTGVKAELVEALPTEAEDSTTTTEGSIASAKDDSPEDSKSALKRVIEKGKDYIKTFKKITKEFNKQELEEISQKFERWILEYTDLSDASKKQIKPLRYRVDEELQKLSKIQQVDRLIDRDLRKMTDKVKVYNASRDFNKKEVVALKEQISQELQDLETKAKFIKDSPLVKVIKAYQKDLN